MITVTSVEARNSFGKLLDSAQREPVVVTRLADLPPSSSRRGTWTN